MDVVVAGSQGFLGTALVARLRKNGHSVRRLVRRPPRQASERAWDPASGHLDPAVFDGADAVVNLAGAGVGDHRWTAAYKRTILESRVHATATIARTLAALPSPPSTWVQGSAIGYYGDQGDTVLSENSPGAQSFLARVVHDWEAATRPAEDAGVRVARARSGIVLAPHGGALGRLLPLIRLGVGGRLGPGTQYWSWISLRDEIAALMHLLTAPIHGPVNLTAPHPVPNEELVSTLATAMHRPAAIRVPSFALQVALGEFATELLGSTRAEPHVLLTNGFEFFDNRIAEAAAWLAGDHTM